MDKSSDNVSEITNFKYKRSDSIPAIDKQSNIILRTPVPENNKEDTVNLVAKIVDKYDSLSYERKDSDSLKIKENELNIENKIDIQNLKSNDSLITEQKKKKESISVQDNLILNFTTEKAYLLTSEQQKKLDNLVKFLVDNSEYRVFIEGHSDNFGTIEESKLISQKRANEVKTYLVSKKGLSPMRVFSFGKGSLFPIAENTTESNRRKNRRVEIRIVK